MAAKETRKCRVCGKDFIPCNKTSADIEAFNYRAVACSQECGNVYLERIIESRKPKEPEKKVAKKKVEIIEPVITGRAETKE